MKNKKVEKLVANLHDKTEYVTHIRNLKQALNHGLVLKKFSRVIRVNQNAWLKPYIYMNINLRKTTKNDFEKYFFKLMYNEVFRKAMENVRKHRDIKFVTTERRINYSVLEPNYHTIVFYRKFVSNRKRNIETLMNKLVYFEFSKLELSKILMYEF